jgi:hypothetical protein
MVTADFSKTVVHLHQITMAHIRPVKTSHHAKTFLIEAGTETSLVMYSSCLTGISDSVPISIRSDHGTDHPFLCSLGLRK